MTPFDPTEPFVLLDDARRHGRGAQLFTGLVDRLETADLGEVAALLKRVRTASRAGLWAAGFLAYEAGCAFEPRLVPTFRPPSDGLPLLWFGLFDRRERLTAAEVETLLPSLTCRLGRLAPEIDAADHGRMIERAQALISAGDIYQANLTFPSRLEFEAHPMTLFRRLRRAQAAPYGALLNTGDSWILSLSPELFFELDRGYLTARPMKGTARRLPDAEADRAIALGLAEDPKNRAENLMIVDLLRNDLARVAEAGSVEVSELFRVDSYPTLHQMVSTITARLAPGRDAVDVLEALFPCGSVTGAPKIRAMEVIREIEPFPRGLYTGSIGYVGPDGGAGFNVAIRTLVCRDGIASLGLGSGIVADSEPASEWAECLTKAAFVTEGRRRFDLIETLRFDASAGPIGLERHLDRLAASAGHWAFAFDREAVRDAVMRTVALLSGDARLRLVAGEDGSVSVAASPLPPAPTGSVDVALAELPVCADDPRLFHKTTDRAFYDEARQDSGTFEVLFVNERGELTEGSFTNLFVPRDGKLLTPPLTCGLLPGVLRAELIDRGEAIESVLRPDDLSGDFFIGNSLRGLIRARLRA